MNVQSLKASFTKAFLAQKDKTAITFLKDGKIDAELSYANLHEDSNRIANMLLELGVKKGDRVVFFFPKSLFLVCAHIAVLKIGAIAVHLNPGFKRSEMEYLLKDSDPEIILCDEGKKTMLQQIHTSAQIMAVDYHKPYNKIVFFRHYSDKLPEMHVNSDDPGVIIYTSGTTGLPKGVVLNHKNIINDANNIIKIWEIDDSDILCHALPLFHIHGLCFALHSALLAGSKVLMFNAFSPELVTKSLSSGIADTQCTVFMAVPAMYSKLIEYIDGTKMDFDHIRLLTSGSAPLLPSDFERICKTFGKEPVEREGMSETGMNFSNPISGIRKPGSIGIPLPNVQVRVVNPKNGTDVAPGQTGEFWLKGDSITHGYWQKITETKKTFEDGWFKTGDLGYVDTDGYYFLTDRLKHIIISGGENVSPKEVEIILNQFPGVLESSVVGVPNAKWGEKIVAAVVPKGRNNIDKNELKEFCRKHLHDWKCPKEFTIVDKMPRNTMGKVLKENVKALFE